MAELGKIERLNIDEYKGKRKLFCITNIFIPDDEDEKLKNLVEQYWQEANLHIEKLEKLGFVTKIFVETIFIEGQEAVDVIRETNPYLYPLIEKKVSQGATVVGIEDPEIFGAFIDWSNCLRIVKTASVLQKVFNYYNEILQKRIVFISNKINESLQEGECAIVILRDQERMKLSLPKDIDIFLIVPSVYDDILKYLRDKFLS